MVGLCVDHKTSGGVATTRFSFIKEMSGNYTTVMQAAKFDRLLVTCLLSHMCSKLVGGLRSWTGGTWIAGH